MSTFRKVKSWSKRNPGQALGAVALGAALLWVYSKRATSPSSFVSKRLFGSRASGDFRTGLQSSSPMYDPRNDYTDGEGNPLRDNAEFDVFPDY